jgi:hypothetical protein
MRLSGFLLWQSAQGEFCFSHVHWPAFWRVDFLRAIRSNQGGNGSFGQRSCRQFQLAFPVIASFFAQLALAPETPQLRRRSAARMRDVQIGAPRFLWRP